MCTERTSEWPFVACPSENLGSLLNGVNTILLGVMAILRHQTKADMHNNAAKNLQSLVTTVEFMRDDMTQCACVRSDLWEASAHLPPPCFPRCPQLLPEH